LRVPLVIAGHGLGSLGATHDPGERLSLRGRPSRPGVRPRKVERAEVTAR
jgi:hypothetical protein